jgi:putative peptidoglycan lipid II flippase
MSVSDLTPDTDGTTEALAPSLLRSSAIVGLGTALSRITGFVRLAAIAYALGGLALASTYGYANETPNMVYELLIGGVLTATLVPLFVQHLETKDDDAVSAIVTVSTVLLLLGTVVGVLVAPWIAQLYALRAPEAGRATQQAVATGLLRLFMPQMFFYGITALATALLNARRRFAAAAFAPIVNNVVVIALFVSLPRLVSGPLTLRRVGNDTSLLVLLGLGTTAGIVAMAIVLLPALGRAGIRLRVLFGWRHPAVVTLMRLSGWTVGYVITNQIALWVVLLLANGTKGGTRTGGGVFAYLAAYAFFQLPHGLFAVSLMTAIAPELASAAARGDLEAMRDRLSLGLRMITVVVLPAAAVYIGLARPIVVAGLQRGQFHASDAARVADVLVAFSVGLIAFSVYLFCLRAYYSLKDTRTPFFINCFENALNIVLAFALYPWLGVRGLAFAFAGAYICAALVTMMMLRRRLRGIRGDRLAATASRALAASAAVCAVTWLVARLVGWHGTIQAIGATALGLAAGAVVYVAIMALLGADELRMVWAALPFTGRQGTGAARV